MPKSKVRKKPDAYWVAGDRTSSHSGVDLGFFVRRGAIYELPEGLPHEVVHRDDLVVLP